MKTQSVLHDMEHVQPATPEEKQEAAQSYEWMKSIATFQM